MSSNVFIPYTMVKKEEKPLLDETLTTTADRQIFSVIDHLMGSRRKWTGIDNRMIPSDGSGRIPGMGSAGMQPEELRVRKFMESCTFKAMISCAGGMIFNIIFMLKYKYPLAFSKVLYWVLVLVCLQQVLIQCQHFKQQHQVQHQH